MLPVFLVFSVFLLWRGHYLPGGGFSGGLVASASVILYGLAHGYRAARTFLRFPPQSFIVFGLSIAALSPFLAVVRGEPFMKGVWTSVQGADPEPIALGTPFLFDIGVYFLVIGIALTIVLELGEDEE